ncbi:hypothetical protein B1810_23645 [Panacagrimonas perspica]|nr:hypothetical protein B1810_23645 [Panacagrimonas perspica]
MTMSHQVDAATGVTFVVGKLHGIVVVALLRSVGMIPTADKLSCRETLRAPFAIATFLRA